MQFSNISNFQFQQTFPVPEVRRVPGTLGLDPSSNGERLGARPHFDEAMMMRFLKLGDLRNWGADPANPRPKAKLPTSGFRAHAGLGSISQLNSIGFFVVTFLS